MTRDDALALLRAHEQEFRRKGVLHLRLFGSVARDEATAHSDIDVLVDFEPGRRLSLVHMGDIWGDLHSLFGVDIDLVREQTLRPQMRDTILREAVLAF